MQGIHLTISSWLRKTSFYELLRPGLLRAHVGNTLTNIHTNTQHILTGIHTSMRAKIHSSNLEILTGTRRQLGARPAKSAGPRTREIWG